MVMNFPVDKLLPLLLWQTRSCCSNARKPLRRSSFPCCCNRVSRTLLLHSHTGRDLHRINKVANQNHLVKNPQVLKPKFQPKNVIAQGSCRHTCLLFLHSLPVTFRKQDQRAMDDAEA